jgi:hypothetical protein
MGRIFETLFFASYWFVGGYAALALTPYAVQGGLIGSILGLLLLLAVY